MVPVWSDLACVRAWGLELRNIRLSFEATCCVFGSVDVGYDRRTSAWLPDLNAPPDMGYGNNRT